MRDPGNEVGLATVLIEYKSTTFTSFEKGSKLFFPFTVYCLLNSFTILRVI